MRIRTTMLLTVLVAGASLAHAQDDSTHGRAVRVWDPNLAQWRIEQPGRVWDPNLARYRYESRQEVWDPYLAQYRPRDARRDPPPPSRQADGRHRHPGHQGWCSARH